MPSHGPTTHPPPFGLAGGESSRLTLDSIPMSAAPSVREDCAPAYHGTAAEPNPNIGTSTTCARLCVLFAHGTAMHPTNGSISGRGSWPKCRKHHRSRASAAAIAHVYPTCSSARSRSIWRFLKMRAMKKFCLVDWHPCRSNFGDSDMYSCMWREDCSDH